jgi:hypothetical protein
VTGAQGGGGPTIAFSAFLSNSIYVSHISSFSTIYFNALEFETNIGSYDSNAGQFTAPSNGLYAVHSLVGLDQNVNNSNLNYFMLGMTRNGSNYKRGTISFLGEDTSEINALVPLQSNDTIGITLQFMPSTFTLSLLQGSLMDSFFSVASIGPYPANVFM